MSDTSPTLEQLCAEFIAPLEADLANVPLSAYRDIAGVWTIGFGHTGSEVVPGLTWTLQEAYDGLAADVAPTLAAVVSCNSRHPWSSNQIVALVSFAFNVGVGALRSSTVLREHNLGSFQAAGAAFLQWDRAHVNGELVEVAGLLNRRKAEQAKYLLDLPT